MNIQAMHAVMAETQAGQLIFPEVVRRLLEVGVESYFCDAAAMQETLYLRDGQTHTAKMALPHFPSRRSFPRAALSPPFAARKATASAIRSL